MFIQAEVVGFHGAGIPQFGFPIANVSSSAEATSSLHVRSCWDSSAFIGRQCFFLNPFDILDLETMGLIFT